MATVPALTRREAARELVDVALRAVEAYAATRRALARVRGRIPLDGCTVFAFGKAAEAMAQAALDEVRVRAGRVHCFRSGRLGPLTLVESAHPFPAPDAAEQGAATLRLAERLTAEDVALCLVSGGGSAMLECPRPGVTLAQIRNASARLMATGADIAALNVHRRTLSRVKGGGLAAAIRPARVVNIVIHDTPGHPVEVVASGPSLPADLTEIAADNLTALRAIHAARPDLRLITTPFAGDAEALGARFAREAPGFVIGGESTVTLCARPGTGGRNQHLVLSAARHLKAGLLLAFGTDGVDGSSSAAGAWIDPLALRDAPDPAPYLARHDSTAFFDQIGTGLRTGPTGTNVADVVIALP